MSRHSTDFRELEHRVPALVEAMEAAHVRRRGGEPGRQSDSPRPSTVYAALSQALGDVSAESLRQDFHKYKLGRAVKGGRVPSAAKVVRLTEAACKLGWFDPLATGSGAEPLVAWCRREMERFDSVAAERAARREATRQARAVSDAERDIDAALTALPPESVKVAATVMLAVMMKRVKHHLLRHEMDRQSDGGFLHGDIAQTNVDRSLQEILEELEDEARIFMSPDERARTGLAAAAELERELVELSLPRNRKVLEADALKLGIGRDQLKLILNCLHSGAGLEQEVARRREELLALYCGFRSTSDWLKVRSKSAPC